jgi:hypothetical protein
MRPENFSDTDEWTRQLLAHFRAPRYQPPLLPVTAVELMALTQQSKITIPEVVAIFEKDPLLAAKLLMHALSAPHGPWEPQSLTAAAERIGIKALKKIVLEVSLNTRVFQAQDYTEALERLRIHRPGRQAWPGTRRRPTPRHTPSSPRAPERSPLVPRVAPPRACHRHVDAPGCSAARRRSSGGGASKPVDAPRTALHGAAGTLG